MCVCLVSDNCRSTSVMPYKELHGTVCTRAYFIVDAYMFCLRKCKAPLELVCTGWFMFLRDTVKVSLTPFFLPAPHQVPLDLITRESLAPAIHCASRQIVAISLCAKCIFSNQNRPLKWGDLFFSACLHTVGGWHKFMCLLVCLLSHLWMDCLFLLKGRCCTHTCGHGHGPVIES